MSRFVTTTLAVLCMIWMGAASAESRDEGPCHKKGGSALQILGSGGPMHGEGRGSAAYVVWLKGRASVLVDVGGGTTAALARAAVAPSQLDALLISHLHPDHVSDLPEFLWGELVATRRSALVIAGPSGGEGFSSLDLFLQKQFGPAGAFADMKGIFSGEPFRLTTQTVETTQRRAHRLFEHHGLRISAYPVPHGRAPALAYRIDSADFSVVFGGDQTGLDADFAAFAMNVDYLVLHAMLSPAAADHRLARVVALPATLGKLAESANAKRVVLSHLMSGSPTDSDAHVWSLSSMPAVIESVRAAYSGPILVASDLQCLELPVRE